MTPIEKLKMLRDAALSVVPDRGVASSDIHAYYSQISIAAQIELVLIVDELLVERKRRNKDWLREHGLGDLVDPAEPEGVIADVTRAVDAVSGPAASSSGLAHRR